MGTDAEGCQGHDADSPGVEEIACRQGSNHCYCWQTGSKFCCGCGALLPRRVGDRLELIDPTPRIRAEVVEVTGGGYVTIKWAADPGMYKNYSPKDIATLFKPF